jgi:uncharacterized Zn-binding protein involved in type VI secretion
MLPAARITDMHVCPLVDVVKPHVGGPVAMGSPDVQVGFIPAARVCDMVTCAGPPDIVAKGSATVFINFMPAARLMDMTAHGGMISVGNPQVLIGG